MMSHKSQHVLFLIKKTTTQDSSTNRKGHVFKKQVQRPRRVEIKSYIKLHHFLNLVLFNI